MARNKAHKSRFASKHTQAKKASGRPVGQTKLFNTGPAIGSSKKGNEAGTKVRRAQAATARRNAKNAVVSEEKAIGSRHGPPRILSLLPINESADTLTLRAALVKACGGVPPPTLHPFTLATADARHRFTYVTEDTPDEQRMLDAIKPADIAILAIDCSTDVQATIQELNTDNADAVDAAEGLSQASGSTWFADVGLCVTDVTRELIQAFNAHGAPTPVVVLQGLHTYDNPKKRQHTFKIHDRYFKSVLAKETKVVSVDDEESALHLIRMCSNIKLRSLKWREQRPYIVTEAHAYDAESRTLQLSGYLRGNGASASMLFHVMNVGTYAGVTLSAPGDPCPLTRADEVCGVLDEADPELQEELDGLQPNETALDENEFGVTEEDVVEAQRKHTVWVPEGVSEYQAHWYDNGGAPPPGEAPAEIAAAAAPGPQHATAFQTAGFDSRSTGGQSDAALLSSADVLRHERMTDEERQAEMDEAEDEERHPDEVDCPIDMPARKRFAKYRSMKGGFNTSAWDPKENLPHEYSRIFELHGYSRIRDEAVMEASDCPGQPGMYVTITLANVPPAAYDDMGLIVVSGQLRHEQKWSVIHCHVQRATEHGEPIKSKTPMLAHIGFRKFFCEPIYSDVVVGNRSKFARYFLPGEKFRIATFYAPIAYHPSPVMLYEAPTRQQQEQGEGNYLRLCTFGAVLPPNPDFLILKRAVLNGRIAVIHKKQLVVKWMFFNEDDVKWFQPVDLWTRLGRQGKILKAVGTHGLFKAAFNDTVFQHDMICMSLYKRMFPKWRTVPYSIAGRGAEVAEVDSDDDA